MGKLSFGLSALLVAGDSIVNLDSASVFGTRTSSHRGEPLPQGRSGIDDRIGLQPGAAPLVAPADPAPGPILVSYGRDISTIQPGMT